MWALVALYTLARVTQAFPGRIPWVAIVACHVLPPLAFAFLDGAAVYRPRGILIYMLACFVIGNLMENLSIRTGFPFGHYQFTEVMGPKLLQVPILLGLAYIGIGYVSWTVAGLLPGGAGVASRPLIAAAVMTAWDLSMEPVWSNLVRAWTWHNGGSYFGVPASNFFGWFLTNFLIYQSFAMWVWWTRVKPRLLAFPQPLVAPLFYGVCAGGNLFVLLAPAPTVVTDAAGVEWHVSAILWTSMLVSILLMGPVTVISCARARHETSPARAASWPSPL